MSRMVRRFEVVLPLRYNDGSAVPDDAIADTLLELEQQFGAVSCDTQTIRGQWRHEGQSYRDDLVRVFVDAADDPGSRQYFIERKERLKSAIPTNRHLHDNLFDRSIMTSPVAPRFMLG